MYKVASTSPTFGKYSMDPVELLKSEGCEVQLVPSEISNNELALAEYLQDVDALIVGVEKITSPVINSGKNLKVIAKHGAGVDNIDLKAAFQKGIPVAFAPGANRHAVADCVFGLMLSLAREIPQTYTKVRQGDWPRVVGTEIFGKTLGVIGTGRIGKEVIRRAKGFEMSILAFDLFPDQELLRTGAVTYVSLEELLKQSDIITIHTDLNENSSSMISDVQFDWMKPSAYLINTARGGIVNEHALVNALKEGKIAGAALDVFSDEPLSGSPLLELPNFIATSHMAGYTKEALREVGMITARNVLQALKGNQPEFVYKLEEGVK